MLRALSCMKLSSRSVSLTSQVKAVTWPKPEYGPLEVQRSDLLNGIRVAAAKPMGAQMAACTIMFQAGSRYEKDNQIGATHFLRTMSGAGGCGYTSFIKTRYLQYLGAYLTCSSDRQAIAFTLRCPVPAFSDLKSVLLDTATRCCYNQWEIDDIRHIVREDLVRIPGEQLAIDLVQQASWTGGLNRSVFCVEERVDSITENDLNCFARQNFKSNVCTVGSVGVPFEDTLSLAESIEFRTERPPHRCEEPSCARGGFEVHDLGPDSDTWVAVAVPGVGTWDLGCVIKHNIIAEACGTGDIESGQHRTDRVPQPPLGAAAGADVYAQYRAFNISYADTGLFGIIARTKAERAKDVAMAAAEFLANVGDLDFKQIEVGKRRLKVSLCFHEEQCVQTSEGLALQLAARAQLDSAADCGALIDCFTCEEISCAAKALSSKCAFMSVAVVGDAGSAPSDRDLVCSYCPPRGTSCV